MNNTPACKSALTGLPCPSSALIHPRAEKHKMSQVHTDGGAQTDMTATIAPGARPAGFSVSESKKIAISHESCTY